MEQPNKIEIFRPAEQDVEFHIILDEDENTIWATEDQIVQLFNMSRRTIGYHIKNIYNEKELDKVSTWRENRQVQIEGNREVSRNVSYYNLDVVISVGYRVKSQVGVEFRKWATSKLKEYLVKGYSLNSRKLTEQNGQIKTLENEVAQLHQLILDSQTRITDGFLTIMTEYTKSFELLNQFDNETLSTEGLEDKIIQTIDYNNVRKAIDELKADLISKGEASHLFGQEKDDSFQGILASISQTVFGELAYRTVEEQAAQLLYSIIKGHSFNDGNKRIGSFIFVWFLEQNKHHLKNNGERKINDYFGVRFRLHNSWSVIEDHGDEHNFSSRHYDLLLISTDNVKERVEILEKLINENQVVSVHLVSYSEEIVQEELLNNSFFFHKVLNYIDGRYFKDRTSYDMEYCWNQGHCKHDDIEKKLIVWDNYKTVAINHLEKSKSVENYEQIKDKIEYCTKSLKEACLGALKTVLDYELNTYCLKHMYLMCSSIWDIAHDIFPRNNPEEILFFEYVFRKKDDGICQIKLDWQIVNNYESRCEKFIESISSKIEQIDYIG